MNPASINPHTVPSGVSGITTPPAGADTNFGTGTPPAGADTNFGTGTPPTGADTNFGTGTPPAGADTNFGTSTPPAGADTNFGTSTPPAGADTNFGTSTPPAGADGKTGLTSVPSASSGQNAPSPDTSTGGLLPLPPVWIARIRRLRAPAISLQWFISERHIPDLDAGTPATTGQGNPSPMTAQSGATGQGNPSPMTTQSGATGQGNPSPMSAQSGATGQGNPSPMSTQNGSYTRQQQLNCTIRYFDAVLGLVSLTVMGCLCRWIHAGCRAIRKKRK